MSEINIAKTTKFTDEELLAFCRGHYYAVDTAEEQLLWEPFENYDQSQVDEWIDNDVYALKRFLGIE